MDRSSISSPWYMTWWGILIIFLTFPLIWPWFVWTKTDWEDRSKLLFIFSVFGIFIFLETYSNEVESTPALSSSSSNSNTFEEINGIELLEEDHNSRVENFHFVIRTDDLSQRNLRNISFTLRSKYCDIDCNIFLYDDAQSLKLWNEMESLELTWMDQLANFEISMDEFERLSNGWDQENYVFMADHHVAALYFGSDLLWRYPLRDARYSELVE